MRKLLLAAGLMLTLGACSTAPYPLIPDSPEGPGSYVCYSNLTSTAAEVRTVADQQCARWSMQVTKVIGQSFSPGRCSVLTPMIAGFRCGRQNGAYDGFSSFR